MALPGTPTHDPNDPTLETSMTQVLADGTELTTLMEYDAEGI